MNHKNIAERYLEGLYPRLSEEDQESLSHASGATTAQLEQLKNTFPDCPESLLQLLSRINGTHRQKYGIHSVRVLILGSDVFEYPYYLKSAEQILDKNKYGESIRERYAAFMDEMPDLVDKGIDPDINMNRWLHFSDCMNNGGTSSLYIDFNPLPGGVKGQVVRFLHDPDSFKVIAQSFDEYLQQLIDEDYSFIIEDEYDEE